MVYVYSFILQILISNYILSVEIAPINTEWLGVSNDGFSVIYFNYDNFGNGSFIKKSTSADKTVIKYKLTNFRIDKINRITFNVLKQNGDFDPKDRCDGIYNSANNVIYLNHYPGTDDVRQCYVAIPAYRAEVLLEIKNAILKDSNQSLKGSGQ
jgi:hypothetical protein